MLSKLQRCSCTKDTLINKRPTAVVSARSKFTDGSGIILGGKGPSSNPGKPGRLILPSQEGGSRPAGLQKLIVPTDSSDPLAGGSAFRKAGGSLTPYEGIPDTTQSVPTGNNFRPPAGFMNNNDPLPPAGSITSSMAPQQMLNKLQARSGQWHQLAKLLPLLNAAGYDSAAIDQATGTTPAQQNIMMVAATVYDSLVELKVSKAVLAHFDADGEALLHPFRFLGMERRVAAAEYIVNNRLDETMCEVLARSMKEYERRGSERSGFSDAPGDCLAFKYLRDSGECRNAREAQQKAELGLKTCTTEGARERLRALLTEKPAKSMNVGTAMLQMLRLSADETGYRAVALLGQMGEATISDLQAAPRTTQGGTFGAFTIDGGAAAASRWVALPQWKAVSMARFPVAISIADCSTVPAVVVAAQAKTEEDRRRLTGVGLIVADREPSNFRKITEDTFYLAVPSSAAAGSKQLQLVDGGSIMSAATGPDAFEVVALVLFLCRPPAREASNMGTDMLQV